MEKILVVDDEKEICDLIGLMLSNEGYTVYKFYNGNDALDCIHNTELDMAILDVMLPGIDGFKLCQYIRENHFYPVMMVTAKSEDMDKITGLTLGTDDYLTKPFNPLELVTRVKTQLRRYKRYNQSTSVTNTVSNQIEIRGLIINQKTHEVTLNGNLVDLTPLEFDILYYLASHVNEVVSSEALFEAVWKEKFYNSNNTVMAHIARLREKLHEPSRNPKYILTVWGVGYKINA